MNPAAEKIGLFLPEGLHDRMLTHGPDPIPPQPSRLCARRL